MPTRTIQLDEFPKRKPKIEGLKLTAYQAEEIVIWLRKFLLKGLENGSINPGDKLCPIRKITEYIKSNKAAVRFACKFLMKENLLQCRNDSNYIVCNPEEPSKTGNAVFKEDIGLLVLKKYIQENLKIDDLLPPRRELSKELKTPIHLLGSACRLLFLEGYLSKVKNNNRWQVSTIPKEKTKIQKKTCSTYQKLKEALKSMIGEMEYSSPLPSSRELSKSFNVGQELIIKALKELKKEKLISPIHSDIFCVGWDCKKYLLREYRLFLSKYFKSLDNGQVFLLEDIYINKTLSRPLMKQEIDKFKKRGVIRFDGVRHFKGKRRIDKTIDLRKYLTQFISKNPENTPLPLVSEISKKFLVADATVGLVLKEFAKSGKVYLFKTRYFTGKDKNGQYKVFNNYIHSILKDIQTGEKLPGKKEIMGNFDYLGRRVYENAMKKLLNKGLIRKNNGYVKA